MQLDKVIAKNKSVQFFAPQCRISYFRNVRPRHVETRSWIEPVKSVDSTVPCRRVVVTHVSLSGLS